MTGIKLELDGQWYEPKDVVWAEYAPCGCLDGVTMVREPLFTADAAWDHLHEAESQAYADWMKDLGFRIVLVTMDAYRASMPMKHCEHTPQWGLPATPTPEGMEWRIPDGYFAKKTSRVHLFPIGDKPTWNAPAASLCTAAEDRGRCSTDGVSGHFYCANCTKLAAALVEAVAA